MGEVYAGIHTSLFGQEEGSQIQSFSREDIIIHPSEYSISAE